VTLPRKWVCEELEQLPISIPGYSWYFDVYYQLTLRKSTLAYGYAEVSRYCTKVK